LSSASIGFSNGRYWITPPKSSAYTVIDMPR
jgi:hypothetical protein